MSDSKTPQLASKMPAPLRYRGRVFVDFWNYELSMKKLNENFLTDWKVLGRVLVEEAVRLVEPNAVPEYQGMNVYASYNSNNPGDDKLRHWMTNTLDKFPGVNVNITARQKKKSGPKCPACHGVVTNCPSCGSDMRGTEEKGVDVSIATDMIRLAWAGNYDLAVLVSSDRDFVPVAEFLDTKDVKVIHGAFPPKASELTQKCWGSLNIPTVSSRFERQAKSVSPAKVRVIPKAG